MGKSSISMLQWGRGKKASEIRLCVYLGHNDPPCFNGAEAKKPRKLLLPRTMVLGVAVLQWGRGKKASEMAYTIRTVT